MSDNKHVHQMKEDLKEKNENLISEEGANLSRGQKLKRLIKTLYYDKRVRFLFVGGLNTLVGVGVEYLVYFLYGAPLLDRAAIAASTIAVASVVSQVIGTIHSYFWNKYFTFRSSKKSVAEFLRFIAVYVVAFGINYGLKMLLNNVWHVPMFATTIITLLVSTLISYFGHNLFSFRDKKKAKKCEFNSETAESSVVALTENADETNDKIDDNKNDAVAKNSADINGDVSITSGNAAKFEPDDTNISQ